MMFEPVLECTFIYAEHITDLYRWYLPAFQHIVYCGAAKTKCLHYIVRSEHLHIADGG